MARREICTRPACTHAIKLASVHFKDHKFISPYFAASAKTARLCRSAYLTRPGWNWSRCGGVIWRQSCDVMFNPVRKCKAWKCARRLATLSSQHIKIKDNSSEFYLPWTEVVFSSPPGRTTTRERSLSMRFSFWSMFKGGFPGNHWDKPGESSFFNPGGDGALLLVDTLLLDTNMENGLRVPSALVKHSQRNQHLYHPKLKFHIFSTHHCVDGGSRNIV